MAVFGPVRGTYMAVYTYIRVHGRVHGRERPCTSRIHGRRVVSARVHDRVRAVYTTGRVRGRAHGPCTRPVCTARVLDPCTRIYVYMYMYIRVHGRERAICWPVRSVLLQFFAKDPIYAET